MAGPESGAGAAPGAADPRERVLALVRRYGWNATSFQGLEPGFEYWFVAEGSACVAYADTGRAWVAAGAPIAEGSRLGEVAARFVAAARRAGRRACFFGTETRFARAAPMRSLPIGEQPVWDPGAWEATVAGSRSMREQLRRARARGVAVRPLPQEELTAPENPLRREIEALIVAWMGSRRMAPMGFVVQVHPFSFPEERRFFAAERGGRLVGFLAMVPVYARSGWLLEDLLRSHAAPNGTAELLIDAAMRAAAAEGSRYATLGLAPLAGGVHGWLRVARTVGRGLYNFEGLRAFRARLRPARWEPIFLSYPPEQSAIATVWDTLSAFACGSLWRFGLETLLRVPELVTRALAVLLVPWTLLLARAPRQWMPSPAVHAAWVLFDLLLIPALFALGTRWRHGLAAALAVLITGDAALTLLQVLLYNAPRARTPVDWLFAGVAVLGPTLAAAYLWTARTYHARRDEAQSQS